jgi:NADPH-dependent 2,4-dienoyl-CoA reductase/sulfur reductase-like enzyme
MAAAKMDAVIEKLSENRTAVAAVAAGGVVVAGAALLYKRQQQAVPKEGPYPVGSLPADAYDAVIVGAGPSGSTAAFYIAKQGGKVALLDKATFPRGEGI